MPGRGRQGDNKKLLRHALLTKVESYYHGYMCRDYFSCSSNLKRNLLVCISATLHELRLSFDGSILVTLQNLYLHCLPKRQKPLMEVLSFASNTICYDFGVTAN